MNKLNYKYISPHNSFTLINSISYVTFLALTLFLITAQYSYSQDKKKKNIQRPVPQVYLKPTVGNYSQYVYPILANMIKQGKKEIYRIYVIPNNTNYQNVQKKYWEGLIAMPSLQAPAKIRKDIDGLGNSTTQFYYNNQTKQMNRISSNSRGNVYKVDTINPDGSITTLVDLTQNKIADYIETTFPNGRTIIAVNELKGLGFLDGQLSGRNAWCDYSSIFNLPRSSMPGCETTTSSGSGGGAYGVDPGAGSNPQDQAMNAMCSGVKRERPGRFSGFNQAQTTNTTYRINSLPNRWWEIQVETTKVNRNETVVTTFTRTFNESNEVASTQTSRLRLIDGNPRERSSQTYINAERRIYTTNETYDANGNTIGSYEDVQKVEKPSEKTDPGPEPLPSDQEGLSIVCNNWFNSKDKKPDSIAELDSKSRADCNPYATTATGTATGSIPSKKQYLDNCYAGLEGSRNIMELVGVSEATSTNCGPYEDPGPDGKCKGNRITQIKNGALINGAGIQAVEICNPLLCQGPPEQ